MRKSRRPIVIASRRSHLARAQAEAVGRVLARLHPHVKVRYEWIESEGDVKPHANLAEEGGKGLFTKRVEQALLAGQADLAVHSLKDLPTRGTASLAIAAVPKRGDARDCLITQVDATALDGLPKGAVVATSGPRRAAQALALRPDLKIKPIRGSVETRLRKVLEEDYADATFLAMAGLQRAGLSRHARRPLDPAILLPAAAQGALAIQCRTDDHITMSRCLPLNDPTTATAVHLERAVVDALAANCHSAVAVLAEPVEGPSQAFRIRARVLRPDGSEVIESQGTDSGKGLDRLVKQIVADLFDQGAKALLREGSPVHQAKFEPPRRGNLEIA